MFRSSKLSSFRKDKQFLEFTEKLKSINDIDRLLDVILYETRKIVKADGGSICLKEKNRLIYRYTHNDTLAKRDVNVRRYLYTKLHLKIDDNSIAGYVANHKKAVNIKDVYHMPANAPYGFNSRFDQDNDYRTKSVLALPIEDALGELIGVMQFFNKTLSNKKKQIVSFNNQD